MENGMSLLVKKIKFLVTLTISSDGKSELTLYGKFNAMPTIKESCFSIATNQYDIINGITSYNQKITLIDCDISGEEINRNGIINQTIIPSKVLYGVSLSSLDEIKFNGILLNLAYLPKWFPNNNLKQKMNEIGSNITEFSLTYTYPPKVELQIEDFQLTINRFLNEKGDYNRTIQLNEGANFILKFEEFYEIDFLLDNYVRPLRDLITFSTEMPSFVISIYVTSTKILHEITSIRKSYPSQIEVITVKNFSRENEEEHIYSDRFLLKYIDISSNSAEFFRKWFYLYRQLKDIYGFLLAPVYNRNLYLQNIFFGTIQAVEGYHRSLMFDDTNHYFNQIDLDPKIYGSIKKKVEQYFPNEESEWVKKKLQYNEPSLKTRILHLINYVCFRLHLRIDAKANIAKRAAYYRNFLAHPQKNIKITDSEYDEIILIEDFLTNILKLNILIELGLTQKFLHNVILRKMRYSFDAINKFYFNQ